ncbi:DNA repair protein RadA [Candidatus Aerophobetes bacterium]|uniref:DNA repair protein RadA n=2 Tax=root TaxID=1 RepID=A0A523Y2J0_UNCAE|nr:MAG: DNA repair protein RadA [Candidatus Aerophobetes bacterium]
MEKEKSRFICQNCQYISFKWLGRCPECGEWDSFYEEKIRKGGLSRNSTFSYHKPKLLKEVKGYNQNRHASGMKEFDRILGGGVVPGSVVLIGGEPGIGKSTLLLEIGNRLSSSESSVLYVSGEESAGQSKLRASRLGIDSDYLYISSQTNLEEIIHQISELNPKIVIIDSIQTVYSQNYNSLAGSPSQIRESTAYLMRLAKQKEITIFIIGHVTKEGAIAGPKILEHIVDTVLYFESERDSHYRILRTVKNRFGSTSEIGIFSMEKDGLKEVTDSSKFFLRNSSTNENASGTAIVPTIEGTRSFLVEIQALVSASNLAIPRRIAQGIDYNRLCLLLAVLEKRGRLRFFNQDVYLNIAGGVKISEPACDLAITLAVASSLKNKPLLKQAVAIGEVGLTGEIRPVSFIEKRIKEAVKLGFRRYLLPYCEARGIKNLPEVELIGVKRIEDALEKGIKENMNA